MRTRRIIAALGIAAAALAIQAPAPAAIVDPVTPSPPGHSDIAVGTQEHGCFEAPISRAVPTAKLAAQVPARYTLSIINPNVTPTNSSVVISTYTCEDVRVNQYGDPLVLPDPADENADPADEAQSGQPTITTVARVGITRRDGVPTPGTYLLWYGTNNRVLFGELERLGLPVYLLTGSTTTVNDATHQITWNIRGGLDYDLPPIVTEPAGDPTPRGDLVLYYDTADGENLKMTYTHQVYAVRDALPDPAGTLYTPSNPADLTRLTPLTDLLANQASATIPAPPATTARFAFVDRASWDTRVETLGDH